ncbi:endonuclease/exonuclease/phosphatase family protein [Nocardia sp. NPDC005978]|uniref:endonuclease/exonuclease/phosphatase family protein n=1 Tax=Nocardia sp. NPDC005978 TaxID=3156725 RepID=UPI0033B351EC
MSIDELTQDQRVTERIARPSKRGWLGWVGVIAGWTGMVAAGAGVGLHYSTTAWEPAVLAASFASYLMVFAIPALLLFAITRRWVSTALAVVVTTAALWSQAPMLWPDGSAPPGTDVVVMQSNLMLGHGSPEAVVTAARDNSAEVLTIEELTPDLLIRLDAAGLADLFPHRFTAPSGGGQGTGIFSRYPLRDGVKFDGFWLNNLRATMIHPDRGPVTVFALHPIPPLSNADVWHRELTRIAEILEAQSGPVLVGGDFNATWDHAPYRSLLTGRYADAAELLGVAALPTWPTDRPFGPFIGIDRVLIAGGHALEINSHTIPGTDHRAVVARLRLAES